MPDVFGKLFLIITNGFKFLTHVELANAEPLNLKS